MALVIDSSAAIQIAMGSAEGLAMSGMIAKGEEVFAPDFLKLECANGFWRYVRARKLTAKQARALYQDSVSLATRFVRPNDLIDEALHIERDENGRIVTAHGVPVQEHPAED